MRDITLRIFECPKCGRFQGHAGRCRNLFAHVSTEQVKVIPTRIVRAIDYERVRVENDQLKFAIVKLFSALRNL